MTLAPTGWKRCWRRGEHEGVWFATGKILRAADHEPIIDATFDEVSRGACAWRCGAGRPDAPGLESAADIRIAPMTAAMFRHRLFEEVGPLDESFESYLEDVDFGLRCAFAGRRGVYVPPAEARHIGSATSGEWNKDTVRRIARNQVLLATKALPRLRHLANSGRSIALGFGSVPPRAGIFIPARQASGSYWPGLDGQSQAVAWATVTAVVEESEQHIFKLQQADWLRQLLEGLLLAVAAVIVTHNSAACIRPVSGRTR